MYPNMFQEGQFVAENNGGGLVGHFGQDKIEAQLILFYYWQSMRIDVKKYVEKCIVCQYA